MQVKMLKQECGPNGNFAPGEKRTVSDDHGRQLIAGGYAVAVEVAPAEKAVVPPQQTAQAPVQETATTPGSGGRKVKK